MESFKRGVTWCGRGSQAREKGSEPGGAHWWMLQGPWDRDCLVKHEELLHFQRQPES